MQDSFPLANSTITDSPQLRWACVCALISFPPPDSLVEWWIIYWLFSSTIRHQRCQPNQLLLVIKQHPTHRSAHGATLCPEYSTQLTQTSRSIFNVKKLCHRSGTLLLGSNGQSRITTCSCSDGWCCAAMLQRGVGCPGFCRMLKIQIELFDLLRRVLSCFVPG